MDVIIVCHTEFGQVRDHQVIADKTAIEGVTIGVKNLIKLADTYGAKVTFAVMPEVAEFFPKDTNHEIALHIHPGWEEYKLKGITFHVGDVLLKKFCRQSTTSTFLRDYTYEEQLGMIMYGKNHLDKILGKKPTSFVAGRWCVNNDTVKALINMRITHDCSAPAHSKSDHFDWSKLPRICMPFHPNDDDYQKKGDLPLLIVPISQMLYMGNVNPESASTVGLSWLKACFLEYYQQGIPLFHICLHSPCMCDPYFISIMRECLEFITHYKGVNFKFASEIIAYKEGNPRTIVSPYFFAMNKKIIVQGFKSIKSIIWKYWNGKKYSNPGTIS